MSDAAAAPAAPAPSAPSAAPTSAPASSGAPPPGELGSSGGLVPPSPGAHPPSGEQQEAPDAAPPKPRFPWKTKARVGDDEHELELDLAEYRHRVKVDGEELEVPFEDLGRSYERVRASMKRFDEASKLRREVEQKEQRLTQRVQQLKEHLSTPDKALALVRDTLGEDVFYRAIAQEVRQRIKYESLPDDQRSAYDQRTQAERALAQREAEIARREAAIKAEEDRHVQLLAEERRKQLAAEWAPELERAGLPAKNERVLRMLAETMNRARRSGAPLTVREAVAMVREEYEALVAPALEQRLAAQRAALAEQPGRSEPQVPAGPPRGAGGRGGPQSSEEFMRQLRASWRR